MADGVVILPSFHEAIKDLPDAERLNLYDAIVRYGLYGEIIELSAIEKSLFCLIKPNIDASQNRHRAAKENGRKDPKEGSNPRGRPPKNQNKTQTENQRKNQTENQDIETETERDSDIDSEIETDSECPTLEDVKRFALENGLKSDPIKFFRYNQLRGWKIGGSPINDWKALLKIWEEHEEQKPKKQYTTAANYQPPQPKSIDNIWKAVDMI